MQKYMFKYCIYILIIFLFGFGFTGTVKASESTCLYNYRLFDDIRQIQVTFDWENGLFGFLSGDGVAIESLTQKEINGIVVSSYSYEGTPSQDLATNNTCPDILYFHAIKYSNYHVIISDVDFSDKKSYDEYGLVMYKEEAKEISCSYKDTTGNLFTVGLKDSSVTKKCIAKGAEVCNIISSDITETDFKNNEGKFGCPNNLYNSITITNNSDSIISNHASAIVSFTDATLTKASLIDSDVINDGSGSSGEPFNGDELKGEPLTCSDFQFMIDIYKLILIVAPIILIVFGTLDFIKAAFSADVDAIKKAAKTFLKRIIAVLILFLLPYILGIMLDLAHSSGIINSDLGSCIY